MDIATGALSALRRLSTVIAIAIVFLFGLASTVYLSLRSPEVRVPDVVGKDRFEAEHILGDAGLNFRVRATRPSGQLKADTVLFQLPRAGEVVKAGQTVAMDISRATKEGESPEAAAEPTPEEKVEDKNSNEAVSENENKPKIRETNKNANENSNANTSNRNANANRPAPNKNVNNANSTEGTNVNSNRPGVVIINSNRNVNQNDNAPPPAAKPSPSTKPVRENP